MAAVAELQRQLTTAQNALKAGQITQSQYNQFYYKQTTLIAQAKQQEGTSASPLSKDPTDPSGSYNTRTTNTGGTSTTWVKSAARLFQMAGVVSRAGFEHGAVGYISNSSPLF